MSRPLKEESKVMSLRLGVRLHDEISAVARTDGMATTEAIRAAIDHYIDARCRDSEFQERRTKRMEKELRVLEHLGERETGQPRIKDGHREVLING